MDHSTASLCKRSVRDWSRFDKDGNIVKITWRAGYGDIFILTGREHLSVVTAVKMPGKGGRNRRAASVRLARCGRLYSIK